MDNHSENTFFKNYNTWLTGNELRIGNLSVSRVVPEFINSVNRLIKKFNKNKIVLDFSQCDTVYPSPLVQLSGYIDYYRKVEGVEFEIKGKSNYLHRTHFYNPIEATKENVNIYNNALDKVWYFKDFNQAYYLNEALINSIRNSIPCEEGVIKGLIWAIYEVMDNVINHTDTKKGYVMAQIAKSSKTLKICIFDYGEGIFKTLEKTEYKPKTAIDAISLCVKKGVTRDKKIGQGNGLYGLYNVIGLNKGTLTIVSGNGGLVFKDFGKDIKPLKDIILLNRKNQSTSISYIVNLDKKVNITKALGNDDLVDFFVDNLIDDNDNQVYKIKDNKYGTGTREAGKAIKNEVLNVIKATNKAVALDFEDVMIITSSFADELISKLIVEYGLFQFQEMIKLKNMNKSIQHIVNQSMIERMKDVSENK